MSELRVGGLAALTVFSATTEMQLRRRLRRERTHYDSFRDPDRQTDDYGTAAIVRTAGQTDRPTAQYCRRNAIQPGRII